MPLPTGMTLRNGLLVANALFLIPLFLLRLPLRVLAFLGVLHNVIKAVVLPRPLLVLPLRALVLVPEQPCAPAPPPCLGPPLPGPTPLPLSPPWGAPSRGGGHSS